MRWMLALVLVSLTVGCGGGDAVPVPSTAVVPSATPRRLVPGTQVDLTASVTRILGSNAFVVADADLPVAGQLVVSDAPVTVRALDLVRVTGRVERFDAAAFDRYGLHDRQQVEPFGDVVIVAATVRNYAPAPASPSAS